MSYQISSQDGNQVQHYESRDEAVDAGIAMANRLGEHVYLSERNAKDDDYEIITAWTRPSRQSQWGRNTSM